MEFNQQRVNLGHPVAGVVSRFCLGHSANLDLLLFPQALQSPQTQERAGDYRLGCNPLGEEQEDRLERTQEGNQRGLPRTCQEGLLNYDVYSIVKLIKITILYRGVCHRLLAGELCEED